MQKKRNKMISMIAEYGISGILFLSVTLCCVNGIRITAHKQQEEALLAAEESIIRGAVNCYTLEGFYPPDYEYLKDHYGICVDEKKYTVFYSVFATNIMPDITVIEK